VSLTWTVTLAIPASARASPPRTSSLSWVRLPGADSCVATQDLAKDVETLLGRGVFVSASRADVSVEGRIEPKANGGFHAVISVRDDKGAQLGTRVIEGAGKCSEMREELALVLAVMIDPDAMNRPPPPQPAPLAPPAPPPQPVAPAPAVVITPPVPPARMPPSELDRKWHLDAGTSLAGEVGLLAHPTLGVRVDALLTPPHWIPLEGYGAVWPYDSVSGSASGTFTLAWVGGGLCPLRYLGQRWLFYGCASGIVGAVLSEGGGYRDGLSPVLAAEIEGRLTLRLGGPFAMRAGVGGNLPILHPSYSAGASQNAQTLYRMSVVAGTADIGLGLVF
jgi:hypothetical protein